MFMSQISGSPLRSVRAGIYDGMKKLARNPGVGHKRQDLTRRELLFWAVYSYLIIYQPDTKPMTIIAVLHGPLRHRLYGIRMDGRLG